MPSSFIPAISSAASATIHVIVQAASACRAFGMMAGHQISVIFTSEVLPVAHLIIAKIGPIAALVLHSSFLPIGLCIAAGVGGIASIWLGLSLIAVSRGEKLAEKENTVTRRVITVAGAAFALAGGALILAGIAGGIILAV